jgi:uncharacterized membrane protein YphA (DoxX/SURF4 family)
MAQIMHRKSSEITDSPLAKFVFSDTRFAWVWLVLRLYMAYTWLTSGFGKLTGTGWVDGGAALKGFWTNAVVTAPKPVITFDWYRQFIQFMLDTQSYVWFGKLVATGELLIGLALLFGAFTGIAAFFGGTPYGAPEYRYPALAAGQLLPLNDHNDYSANHFANPRDDMRKLHGENPSEPQPH